MFSREESRRRLSQEGAGLWWYCRSTSEGDRPCAPLPSTTNNCGVHLVFLKTPDFTKEAQLTLEKVLNTSQPVSPVPGQSVQRPRAWAPGQ